MKKIVLLLTVVFAISTINTMAQKGFEIYDHPGNIPLVEKKSDENYILALRTGDVVDGIKQAVTSATKTADGAIADAIKSKVTTKFEDYETTNGKGHKVALSDVENFVSAVSGAILSGLNDGGIQLERKFVKGKKRKKGKKGKDDIPAIPDKEWYRATVVRQIKRDKMNEIVDKEVENRVLFERKEDKEKFKAELKEDLKELDL